MTQKKPIIGNKENSSAQHFIERLKSKGFLPELNKKNLEERNKALTDMLINIDDNTITSGKPFGCWDQRFAQGFNNTRNANMDEETEVSIPSMKR